MLGDDVVTPSIFGAIRRWHPGDAPVLSCHAGDRRMPAALFSAAARRAILRRTMPTRPLTLALALSLAFFPACGGEAKKGEPAAAAPGKADEPKKAEDDPIARRRAEREAKAKAEKEAEDARVAAVDKLCVLPAKLPKDIKKACDAVAEAQLKFFEKMYTGAELEKLKAAQGTQRPMTISQCTGTGSIQAAACQANALSTAEDPTLKASISDIMRVCLEKFAKPAG